MRGLVMMCVTAALIAGTSAWVAAQPPSAPWSAAPDKAAVARVLTAAADWQLAHPSGHPAWDWTQAAYDTGMMALTWGINHGVPDRSTSEPAVWRGWQALVSAVHPDGCLGWVQPIAEPGATTAESTEVFGVGAFLLAGSEVHLLAR